MALLELSNITAGYDKNVILKDFNLSVEKGEFVSLLGSSGCGKTTTLRLIAGFSSPMSGKILFGGRDYTHVPLHKRNFGFVFQSYALFPHMTVFDNVAFGLKMRKIDRETTRREVMQMLRLVDLEGFESRYPREMSGGQRQRVALARALVIKPDLLLFDEPLSNLDAKLRVKMRVEIRRIQQELGFTAIYVTHDQEEALAISDRIAVMKEGNIMQIGTPTQIYAKPENPFVAGFIGVSNFLDCQISGSKDAATVSIKGELELTMPLRRDYQGPGKISARPEQLFFADSGMPGKVTFSTFLGDFVEYEVQLNDGQELTVNEYTKDTNTVYEPGQQVFLRFDPSRISLYEAESGEVLSL